MFNLVHLERLKERETDKEIKQIVNVEDAYHHYLFGILPFNYPWKSVLDVLNFTKFFVTKCYKMFVTI